MVYWSVFSIQEVFLLKEKNIKIFKRLVTKIN